MPDIDGAIKYALKRLQTELPSFYTYHSISHTRDEVVIAVEKLAKLENVTGIDRLLLVTAAYFHDVGFVLQRQDHEEKSVEILSAVLPGFGYSASHIAVIKGIIMATRMPQSPTTLLEKIMADGDLDNFGHANFFQRSLDLRKELAYFGTQTTDVEWYIFQLAFLKSHQYFTSSAQQLRNDKKQANIRMLKQLINKAKINAQGSS